MHVIGEKWNVFCAVDMLCKRIDMYSEIDPLSFTCARCHFVTLWPVQSDCLGYIYRRLPYLALSQNE